MGLVRAALGGPVRFHNPRGLLAGELRGRNCLVMCKRGTRCGRSEGCSSPGLFPTQPCRQGRGREEKTVPGGTAGLPHRGAPPGGPGLGRRRSPAGQATCFR